MIQDVMIFALGFLSAGLLSLLALPIVSRRALRLATRRLSMLVPLSMREIVAERDQIRAGHAAETRRLEQSIEQLTLTKAAAMAEAGRHAARSATLSDERNRLAELASTLEIELAGAKSSAYEAGAELGLQTQVLYDTLGLAERRLAILHTTEALKVANEALADEQRMTIAGLETRATGQDLRIRGLMAHVATAAEDLRVQRHLTATAEGERDALQGKLYEAENEIGALRTRLAQAETTRAREVPTAAGAADFRALQRLLESLAERTGAELPAGSSLRPGQTPDMARLRAAVSAVAAGLVEHASLVAAAATPAPPPQDVHETTVLDRPGAAL